LHVPHQPLYLVSIGTALTLRDDKAGLHRKHFRQNKLKKSFIKHQAFTVKTSLYLRFWVLRQIP
jgi:hypothetical protein